MANHEIFLSHATRDSPLVAVVSERLRAVGVSVYLAEADGKAGEAVHPKITAALGRSSAIIVLLTEARYSSNYVNHTRWSSETGLRGYRDHKRRPPRIVIGPLESPEQH